MSWFLPGTPSVKSTAATATNPTTATIIAELTSTGHSTSAGFGMQSGDAPKQVQVSAFLGTSTQATAWWLEHVLSTGIGSTAIKSRRVLITPSGATSQFVVKYDLVLGDRIRVRVSAAFTGSADGYLDGEVIS